MKRTCPYLLAIAMMLVSIACSPIAVGVEWDATPTNTISLEKTATPLEVGATLSNPIVAPTDDDPTQCPSLGNATLPAAAPAFADYPATIQSFLSSGGSPSALRESLSVWGNINAEYGAVSSGMDYTGDGVPEVVAAVVNLQEPQWGGGVYIYACSGGAYTLIYTDDSTQATKAGSPEHGHTKPQLISEGLDLNGNGIDDLLYTTSACGASTCTPHAVLLEWNAADMVFHDLATNLLDEPTSTISVDDLDKDGTYELIVDMGMIGSLGAGPQRTYGQVYRWDGQFYIPGERVVTTREEQWHPIHFLMDADDALEAGEYTKAIALYQRVIDNPNPEVVKLWPQEQIPALQAYARYRIMETHIWMNDLATAQTDYDALSTQYISNLTATGSVFFSVADTYWRTYSSTQDKTAACQAVVTYASANPDSYKALYFGYANKEYTSTSLCLGGE